MSPSTASYIKMVFGFCNAVLGISVLAMPFCFYQCGVLLSLVTFGCVTYLSFSSCTLLVSTAHECRVRRYEQLAFLAFGLRGKLFVEVCSVVMMVSYLVALLILGGNLVPELLDALVDLNTETRVRELVILCLGTFLILPASFCWSRRLLSITSTLTLLLFVVLLFVMVGITRLTLPSDTAEGRALLARTELYSDTFSGSLSELHAHSQALPLPTASLWSLIAALRMWNIHGLLVVLPILANSVTCQAQLFVVCDAFRNELTPTVFRRVMFTTMGITFLLYCSIGVMGYAAFRDAPTIHGDVFLNFSVAAHSNTLSTCMFRVLFVVVNLISSPICIAPCRLAIHSLLQSTSQEAEMTISNGNSTKQLRAEPRITLKASIDRHMIPSSDRRFVVDFGTVGVHSDSESSELGTPDVDATMTRVQYIKITVGIVFVSVCVAVLVPTVEFLFALIGGLFAASLCYAMPAAIYKRLSKSTLTFDAASNNGFNGSTSNRRYTRLGGSRDLANLLIIFGCLVMLLTTLGTLRSPPESAPLENVVDALHAERLRNERLVSAVGEQLQLARPNSAIKIETDGQPQQPHLNRQSMQIH